MKKHEELTSAQKDMLEKYRDMGLEIGFSVHNPDTWDLDKIHEIANKHRKLCGVEPSKTIAWAHSPREAMKAIPTLSSSNALYGNQDIHWLNFYNFFRCELGLIEETEKIVHLLELTKHTSWMWFANDLTIVCRKPVEIATMPTDALTWKHPDRPTENFTGPMLHNTDGPSMLFGDGEKSYHMWGYHLSEKKHHWVVETPADQIKPKDILAIDNADVRALAIRKVGVERMFDSLDKRELHHKIFPVGGEYKLFEVDIEDGTGVNKYLQMICPSKGSIHIEGVPNECSTIDQALGWQFYHQGWENPKFTYIEPRVQS